MAAATAATAEPTPSEVAVVSTEEQPPSDVALSTARGEGVEKTVAGSADAAADCAEMQVHPKASTADTAGPKRKRVSASTAGAEAVAAKMQRLQAEAERMDAEVVDLEAQARVLDAAAAGRRAEAAARLEQAAAKRGEVRKASQDYLRKQSEAALAQMEDAGPKKPSNPYILWISELKRTGKTPARDGRGKEFQNAQIAEMWANLPDAEKQPFKDTYTAETKKYGEWLNSEEGQKFHRERAELMCKCKATTADELAGATAATSTATVATLETPTKQRRAAPAKAQSPAVQPGLDEKVIEEASKADLLAQLRNLASRPDIHALAKSGPELLEALKATDGRVNAAKHALLSASEK